MHDPRANIRIALGKGLRKNNLPLVWSGKHYFYRYIKLGARFIPLGPGLKDDKNEIFIFDLK